MLHYAECMSWPSGLPCSLHISWLQDKTYHLVDYNRGSCRQLPFDMRITPPACPCPSSKSAARSSFVNSIFVERRNDEQSSFPLTSLVRFSPRWALPFLTAFLYAQTVYLCSSQVTCPCFQSPYASTQNFGFEFFQEPFVHPCRHPGNFAWFSAHWVGLLLGLEEVL